MTTLIDHWINGQIVATSAERTGAVYDPATGQQAAQVAYPAWRDNGRGRDREQERPRPGHRQPPCADPRCACSCPAGSLVRRLIDLGDAWA
jgi:hypothetical protein